MNALGIGNPRLGRRDPTGRRAASRSVGQRRGVGAIIRAAVAFAWPIAWRGAILGALAGAAIALSDGGHGYSATADVLVRPNAVDATFFQNDTRALLDTEMAVVRSSEIIDASARTVPGIDPSGLAKALSVQPDPRHSTLRISVRADEPDLARTLTNSVASTYLASVQTRSDVVRRSVVSVLHEATDAVRINTPDVATSALAGVALAAAGCFAMTVLWRIADPRLLDADALELTTGRPLVGQIPPVGLDEGRLVMIAEPNSPAADAYRSLVSTIPFFALEEGVRCVAVTGSSHRDQLSEPHSDVAINLAIACANSGIRTMFVSGDLRNEAFLARQLRPDSPGLTDLILARAPWRESSTWRSEDAHLATGDVVYMTSIANLSFVPTGRTAPNPGDVLSSRAAGVALSHLKHLCDLVILDTPSYANPETASIVRYAEAVIAVVSRGSSRKAALRTLASTTKLQAVPLYFVLSDMGGGRRRRRSTRVAEGTAALTTASVTPSASSPTNPSPTNPIRTQPVVPPASWTPPVPSAPPAPPPPPPSARPSARPHRPAFPSPSAGPAYDTTMTATLNRPSLRTRAYAWNQARLTAKLAARAIRQQAREEIRRQQPPPRGKQY